jgi:hypothetical protein
MFSFVYTINVRVLDYYGIRVSIHTDVWQICIDSVIGI